METWTWLACYFVTGDDWVTSFPGLKDNLQLLKLLSKYPNLRKLHLGLKRKKWYIVILGFWKQLCKCRSSSLRFLSGWTFELDQQTTSSNVCLTGLRCFFCFGSEMRPPLPEPKWTNFCIELVFPVFIIVCCFRILKQKKEQAFFWHLNHVKIIYVLTVKK